MRALFVRSMVVAAILLMFGWFSAPKELDAQAVGQSSGVGGCNDKCADWSENCPDGCKATRGGHCLTQKGYNAECNKPSTCGEEGYDDKCRYPRYCTATGDLCPGSPPPP